jgi:hypothetical protein
MSQKTVIVVASDKVVPRTITSNKTKNEITFREQRAALAIDGEDFPHPFNINLDKDQPPYPPGKYTLDASCLRVGDFEQLQIGRLKLLPLVASAPAARAAG